MRGDSSLTYYTHSGQYSYNSLQMRFQSRFHRNSSFQLAYTWSKLISDTQLIDTPNNNLDFYNPGANRGPDQLNRPQILSANWIYNLPALQQQNRFVKNALGAWEISSIISVATGPSMTGIIGNSPVGDPSGTGSGCNELPMRVAGQGGRPNTAESRQRVYPPKFALSASQIANTRTEHFRHPSATET